MKRLLKTAKSIQIDFGTKNIIKIVLAFQFVIFGLIGLDSIEVKIPILRQAVCFIYLSFIPGILILRILKLHKLSVAEIILCSIGLSLSFLMFAGALINSLYPLIGISKPISEIPLIITINIIVILLCFLCYSCDKENYPTSISINTEQILSPSVLSLLSLPFLAIFGTYFLNFYNNNILLLILLVIISIIPILIAFDKIPEKAYPLAIWVISLSLLFHISLVSKYMIRTDAVFNYYFVKLVITNGFWDSTIPESINAMLSSVMLLPIYSEICSMKLAWVYKIIVPLLYSIVPFGLYQVFRRETNEKIAFLSCFFFASQYEFFAWAGLTMKQSSAGLFLTLLLLLISNEDMNRFGKAALAIIFGFSLATSHYGTSYIFMFCIIAVMFIFPFLRKILKSYSYNKADIATHTFVVLYIVFALSWYMYIASSSRFIGIVNTSHHMVDSILAAYYLPESSYTSHILFGEWSLSLQILKIMYIISSFFIAIGLLDLFYKRTFKFNDEYAAFSIVFFCVNLSMFVGAMSSTATPDRIFHLTSFCLAPFCVIGGMIFIKGLVRATNFFIVIINKKECFLKLSLSFFLMIFLLINTGFISEVILKDFPGSSIYISKERIIKTGNLEDRAYLYNVHVSEVSIFSAEWLVKNRNNQTEAYADSVRPFYETGCRGIGKLRDNIKIKKKAYIYLRYFNVDTGKYTIPGKYLRSSSKFGEVYLILTNKNKIYDNGGSEIYK